MRLCYTCDKYVAIEGRMQCALCAGDTEVIVAAIAAEEPIKRQKVEWRPKTYAEIEAMVRHYNDDIFDAMSTCGMTTGYLAGGSLIIVESKEKPVYTLQAFGMPSVYEPRDLDIFPTFMGKIEKTNDVYMPNGDVTICKPYYEYTNLLGLISKFDFDVNQIGVTIKLVEEPNNEEEIQVGPIFTTKEFDASVGYAPTYLKGAPLPFKTINRVDKYREKFGLSHEWAGQTVRSVLEDIMSKDTKDLGQLLEMCIKASKS